MSEKCSLEGCYRDGKHFLFGKWWCTKTHCNEANGTNQPIQCNGHTIPVIRAGGRVPMSDRRH